MAERLSLSVSTLYKYVEQKKITFVRLPGGDIRFNQDAISDWLEKRTIKAQKKIA